MNSRGTAVEAKKLPVSVQLVALTAALVFCVAAITVYSYTRVLLQQWNEISQVPNRFSLLWGPARSACLALFSAAMFFFIFVGPARIIRHAATAYVIILLLWICWQPAYWIIQGHAASAVFQRPDVLVRFVYLAWTGLLLYLLNPSILPALRRQ